MSDLPNLDYSEPVADEPVVASAPIPSYSDKLIDARLAGHDWGDVDQFVDQGTSAALAEGHPMSSIMQFLGFAPLDHTQARMTADAHSRLAHDEAFAKAVKENATGGLLVTPLEQPSADRMQDYASWEKTPPVQMPEGDKPLAPSGLDLNDTYMRNSYARSLFDDAVRSPRDFAERYAGGLAMASDIDPGSAIRAAGELSTALPSDRDFTDQAIAIAHSSGVALDADNVKVVRNNLVSHWADTGQPLQDTYKHAFNDPEFAATLTTEKRPQPSLIEQFAATPNAEIMQHEEMSGWVVDRLKDWYSWRLSQPDAQPGNWDEKVKEAQEFLKTGKLSEDAMNVALGFAGGSIKDIGAKFGEAIGLLKPLEAGTVRLYRGETSALPGKEKAVPDWIKDSPEYQSNVAAQGRWFTADLEEASHYAREQGGDASRVSYVDVPAGDAEKYLSANQPEAKPFSAVGRETSEYFLPRDLADTRQPHLLQKFADAIKDMPEPKVKLLDPAAPGGIAGEIPFTKSLEQPKPAERAPVEPLAEGAAPKEPPSPLEFHPEATPSEKMVAITDHWTEGNPEVRTELAARNGGELPKETDPQFFEKLAAGQDPATIELAKGHDAAGGALDYLKTLAGDLWRDESGALYLRRTPQQAAERAAYTDARDYARPLIVQMRSRGEQVMSHFANQADNWKTVSGQMVNVFKLLEPHLAEFNGELAKGITGNPMNTMIGNMIQYVEGRSTGFAMRHDSPLTPVADFIRYVNLTVRDMLEDGFARGVINYNSYFEDYFRHMWKDPNKASLAFNEFRTRVGKLGSSSGLKQRTLPTFEDGLKMGLEPVMANPLELTLFDAGQKLKYLQSAEILKTANTAGYVKWRVSPQGEEVALDSFRASKGIPNDPLGRDLTAYANPGFANTWNDWISKGFHQRPGATSSLYDKTLYAFNTMNGIKLAVPMFHAMTEVAETFANGMAHGLALMGKGHPIEAAKEFALALPGISTARAISGGGRIIEQYNQRFITNPALQALVDAGGRFGPRQEIYRSGSAPNMGVSIRRGQLINDVVGDIKRVFGDAVEPPEYRIAQAPVRALGMVAHEVGRVLNTVGAPLFDHMIPRIKAYANVRQMEQFLRDTPLATQEQIAKRADQIVRNTDERFGEMNMDNVFWRKGVKQTAQLGMVSVGWVYGWARLMASAAGLNLERMAFEANPVAIRSLVGFSMAYAMEGMAYQYAKTGTFAWDNGTPLHDILAPRTGGKDQYGAPERALLPSQAKEVVDYAKVGATAAYSPMLGIQEAFKYAEAKGKVPVQALMALATGKDAIGNDIAHTAGGWTGYLKDMFNPIFYGALDQRKKGTEISPAETMMGIHPMTKAAQNPEEFYKGLAKHDQRLWKEQRSRAIHENRIYINPRPVPGVPALGAPGTTSHPTTEQLLEFHRQRGQ